MTLFLNFFICASFSRFSCRLYRPHPMKVLGKIVRFSCSHFSQTEQDCALSNMNVLLGAGKYEIFVRVRAVDSTSQYLLTTSNCSLNSTVVLEIPRAPLSVSKSKEPSPSYLWFIYRRMLFLSAHCVG
jgi:hypothetical protein